MAHESLEGSSIYYEDLIDNKFIDKSKLSTLLKTTFHPFSHRFDLSEEVMKIDYLMDVEHNLKPLDTIRIKSSPIKFFVKVFDIKEKKTKYIEARSAIFKSLKASSAAIPFYSRTVDINKHSYVDSSVLSDLADENLQVLAEKSQDKKIICVLNCPLWSMMRAKSLLGNLLWAISVGIYFKSPALFFKKVNALHKYFSLKKLFSYPNVISIESEILMPMDCTDRMEILKLYNHGIAKGESFIFQSLKPQE